MAINKVVYGNQTLVDLTGDTAQPEDVAQGKTFHDASGVQRTGSGSTSGVVDVEVNGSSVVNQNRVAEVVVPTKTSELNNDSDFVVDNPTFTIAVSRANIESGEGFSTILGKIKKFFADLKAVAFSGSYNDLSDKPTIPSVGNGTLTIQKNGTDVQTFTANQSGNATANIADVAKTVEISTSNVGSIVVTHIATTSGGRHQMFAYGNGNGVPWMMEIQYGFDYVQAVVLCNISSKVGVRYIDNTHFAIISGNWDVITISDLYDSYSVALASTSYTIDTDKTYYPYASSCESATTASKIDNVEFENNNSTGKNANDVTYNGHTYYTSNGPSTSLGASANDGALYVQAWSDKWVAQIAQDYRNGRLFVRGKNNGTWQSWKRIANYDEIPTNNNQLTNGAGYITSSGSCASATASSYVKDYNNNTPTYLGYSTSAMAQSSVTWLGAWDASVSGQFRLRAVKQADLRVAYAASAGSATDSTKVAKIETVGVASCSGSGQYNYFKIATLTITGGYVNGPIAFELSQRQYQVTMIQVSFTSTNASDPGLSYFITNGATTYYIKKTATSTWEVYGKYSEPWGACSLHRIVGYRVNNGVSVTVNMSNIADPTSGAAQATYGGVAEYATKDGNGNDIVQNYAAGMEIVPNGPLAFTYMLRSKNGNILSQNQVQLSSSSRKFKKNIAPLSDEDAKKILDVETVTFDYTKEKDNYTSRKGYKNIGCIAEDVNEIIPELVTEDEKGEIYGINYTEFIPYLIKMVQMQQKEIDELKAIIKGVK